MSDISKLPIRPKPFEPFDFKRLYADAGDGPPLQRLRTGGNLKQLSEDYALFTVAPLVLRAGLPVNPIREWLNENNLTGGVWLLALPAPVVELGPSKLSRFWASKLWACDKAMWAGLSYRLGTIAVLNRDTKTFVRSVCQVFDAPDAVALTHTTVLSSPCPMFELTTFGLDGNKGMLVFEPAKAPPLDLPRLVTKPADPQTVALAEAVFSDAARPYDAAAAHLHKRDGGEKTTDG